MASPIELIRQGILQADWQAVCDGFEGMSGLRLPPPQASQDSEAAKLLGQIREMVDRYVTSGEPVVEQESNKEEDAETEPQVATETEEPPGDAESVRARELADRRRDPTDQFRVVHKGPSQEERSDGKKICKKQPFQKPTGNDFEKLKPTIKDTKEAKVSKALSKVMEPHETRPAIVPVKVECDRCNKQYEVEPIFAPRKLERDDEKSAAYICDHCMGGAKR